VVTLCCFCTYNTSVRVHVGLTLSIVVEQPPFSWSYFEKENTHTGHRNTVTLAIESVTYSIVMHRYCARCEDQQSISRPHQSCQLINCRTGNTDTLKNGGVGHTYAIKTIDERAFCGSLLLAADDQTTWPKSILAVSSDYACRLKARGRKTGNPPPLLRQRTEADTLVVAIDDP